MTVQVEKILAAESKAAGKGSIVHDGMGGASLVCTFLHCLQLIQQPREVTEDWIVREVTETVNFLLSLAPLHTPVREMVDSVDAEVGGLVDESPANLFLFFYSGGILKIRRAKKKGKTSGPRTDGGKHFRP